MVVQVEEVGAMRRSWEAAVVWRGVRAMVRTGRRIGRRVCSCIVGGC